jgi:hypothetical protein
MTFAAKVRSISRAMMIVLGQRHAAGIHFLIRGIATHPN